MSNRDGVREHLNGMVFNGLVAVALGLRASVEWEADRALAGVLLLVGAVSVICAGVRARRALRAARGDRAGGGGRVQPGLDSREQEEIRRAREEARTGWWVTPGGDLALVRWDPVIGLFLLDGRVWPDTSVLRDYMQFCERHEGWAPLGDDGTEFVRERLGLRVRP